MKQLHQELEEKVQAISNLEKSLEEARKQAGSHEEDAEKKSGENAENIQKANDERIRELEGALIESLKLAAEREVSIKEEEEKKKKIVEKVAKMEQRLKSLQAAQALRCHSCHPVVTRMHKLELRLNRMVAERKEHLEELAHMK